MFMLIEIAGDVVEVAQVVVCQMNNLRHVLPVPTCLRGRRAYPAWVSGSEPCCLSALYAKYAFSASSFTFLFVAFSSVLDFAL